MIWLNGQLSASDIARIDPSDRGLLLGDGLFETLLAIEGTPIRLSDHLYRLTEGAGVLDVPMPFDVPAIADAVKQLITENGLRRAMAAVRVTLTRGTGQRGLAPPAQPAPTLMITATQYQGPREHPGMSAMIVPDFRRNEGSPLSRLKTLCYLDNVLALATANRNGHDEALMLNNAGSVVCASRANLFVLAGDHLMTPPASDGALPGITRRLVIECARALGHVVVEESITREIIDNAREIFITNSLVGIVPLVRVGAREFKVGEMSRALRGAYRDLSE